LPSVLLSPTISLVLIQRILGPRSPSVKGGRNKEEGDPEEKFTYSVPDRADVLFSQQLLGRNEMFHTGNFSPQPKCILLRLGSLKKKN
jgi:hypothetical protein